METISHTHNPARTFQRVVPGQEPWRTTEPATDVDEPEEGAYAAPATLPTASEIRSSLLDAEKEVTTLGRELQDARRLLATKQYATSDPHLAAEVRERAQQERWAATFPEFESVESEILERARAAQRTIQAQYTHVDELARMETIPNEAFQAANTALPFIAGEIDGMAGSVLVSRLQAVATLNDHGQILAWRLAARGWAKANPADPQVKAVRRLADDLGNVFRTSDPGAPVRSAQKAASDAASALIREIQSAQSARGGGFSEPGRWGLKGARTQPSTERRTGYEKE